MMVYILYVRIDVVGTIKKSPDYEVVFKKNKYVKLGRDEYND